MYNPLYIANNIIARGQRDNVPVTSMKLQKILYFVYREYIQKKEHNVPLFAERFATWKYGPVLVSVYTAFKKYMDKPITDFYRENNIPYGISESNDIFFKSVLDNIWDKTKNYDGVELSKITHKEGGAWYQAYQNDKIFLDDNDILKDKVEINLNNGIN